MHQVALAGRSQADTAAGAGLKSAYCSSKQGQTEPDHAYFDCVLSGLSGSALQGFHRQTWLGAKQEDKLMPPAWLSEPARVGGAVACAIKGLEQFVALEPGQQRFTDNHCQAHRQLMHGPLDC